MANYDDIVGWFYRNGKRIPIRGKKGEKSYQGKNTKEVLDKVKADRGLEVDSADKQYMTKNPRAINGDRVDLIGKNKKMSATFNSYSDGGKELINFRREPDRDMLRKNAKQRGAKGVEKFAVMERSPFLGKMINKDLEIVKANRAEDAVKRYKSKKPHIDKYGFEVNVHKMK